MRSPDRNLSYITGHKSQAELSWSVGDIADGCGAVTADGSREDVTSIARSSIASSNADSLHVALDAESRRASSRAGSRADSRLDSRLDSCTDSGWPEEEDSHLAIEQSRSSVASSKPPNGSRQPDGSLHIRRATGNASATGGFLDVPEVCTARL